MGVKVKEKKKGSGEWWIFINHKGKRKAKKIGRDKRVAEKMAKQIEAKLVLGESGLEQEKEEEAVPTFAEYADIWMNVTVPATCKRSTVVDYESILRNHVLPRFGKYPVNEINRQMVKTFLMKKVNQGYSSSTVTHIKNAVSGVLNHAVDDEVITVNPSHSVGKIFRKNSRRIKINPLNKDELAFLLATLKQGYPQLYPFFLTSARTGMRLGEVLALQWGDIDFDDRFITVQRGFSRGKIETPKNDLNRKVDMSLQLAETLKDFKHVMKRETLKKGWKKLPKWVFVNEEGNPYYEVYVRRLFYKVLEEAGLRKIRIHDLRHTYASLRISKGDNIADVSNQLGHHSVKFTMDIYYHWIPGGNKSEVDGLDYELSDATICNLYATKNEKVNQ